MNNNCCPHSSSGPSLKGRDLNDSLSLNEARAITGIHNVAILGKNKQPQVIVKTGTQDEIVKEIIEKAPKPIKDRTKV